ncbi:MAG: hypothetical protein ACPGWR_04100 [Ardenticatenaceae bacterium]
MFGGQTHAATLPHLPFPTRLTDGATGFRPSGAEDRLSIRADEMFLP